MSSIWTREQEEELAQLFERYKGDEGKNDAVIKIMSLCIFQFWIKAS